MISHRTTESDTVLQIVRQDPTRRQILVSALTRWRHLEPKHRITSIDCHKRRLDIHQHIVTPLRRVTIQPRLRRKSSTKNWNVTTKMVCYENVTGLHLAIVTDLHRVIVVDHRRGIVTKLQSVIVNVPLHISVTDRRQNQIAEHRSPKRRN
jgi:hypothetical protein